MALGLLLRLVNFVGHGIVDTFSTCISLNYVLGERIVWLLNVFLSWVYSIVVTLLTAIKILLEDLLVFLKEGVDSILFGIECVFGLIDAVVSGVGGAANAVHQAGLSTAHSVSAHAHNLAQGLSDLLSQSAEFLNLLGASVMLLLNLVPRSLYLIFQTVTGLGVALWTRFRDLGSNSVEAFRSAPVEMFIGLLTGLVMMYLLHKVFLRLSSRARDLILEYEITPGQVLRIVAGSLAFVYLNFVRGVIFFFGTIFQVLVVSLANIHVPRFHHAVDSDNDDEVDHQGLVGPVDDSDTEETVRAGLKRRNYDNLLKRRQRRQPGKKRDSGENVEDLLFEQVEREREDKLCVICQDQEKCIMILPCRHLCICQACQGPLQAANNNCPICRKNVRQTIKAYL